PRARLMGRPVYARDERAAGQALAALGAGVRERVIVEDPDRPLPEGAVVSGTAAITREEPERVEVATDSAGDAYLVLADSFDPGWSARLDGRPVPIRPAFVAFRAVFVPAGQHRIVFTYRPAGFEVGLAATGAGLAVLLGLLASPRRLMQLGPEHGDAGWPRRWPAWGLAAVAVLIAASAVQVTPGGLRLHRRWAGSFHRFTWGAGLEAMRPRPPASE
ncbi:MAG TPA: YfhO family protein, partial [Isosphaeraceae bacterium]